MNFGMSFPALNGDVVMQGHADYCKENGHATHTTTDLDGNTTTSERCPRCGKLTDAAKEAVAAAATLAKATGATEVTHTTEQRNTDGTLTTLASATTRKGNDYTIQVWSIMGTPIAECDCPAHWRITRAHGPALERAIAQHRKMHADNGDSTEVV